MEDPEDYYDMDDDYDGDSHENPERTAYPPRLMVDFNSLAMNTLLRYAQFYQITVRDGTDKAHLAAVVARHFDGTLDVEEDESIVSFMQRIRNGEKSVVRHRPPEKDRSSKHKDKARKKSTSTSRKRPRDASVVGGKDASANGSSDHVKHADIDASPSRSKPSSGSGSGGAGSNNSGSGGTGSGGSGSGNSGSGNSGSSDKSKSTSSHKKTDAKKKSNDNGEDNELYCICNLPSYGNMIACDGKNCPNPSQWYHLECVGFSDGRHPDTWLCPECDPKGFADFKSKKKKHAKQRSKSPGSK